MKNNPANEIAVPYLTEAQIEHRALRLIEAYSNQFEPINQPPIPVDEIAECLLGLNIRIEDLGRLFGEKSILGATLVETKDLLVDGSLDPHNNPQKLGRYRFTVGHEIGHWDLHAPILLSHARQGSLFNKEHIPPIICRYPAGSKPRQEWQADTFSALLLMPKSMVLPLWRGEYGDEPFYTDRQTVLGQWSLADDPPYILPIARDFAKAFAVSGHAMQIRLVGLGLIKTGPRQQRLL